MTRQCLIIFILFSLGFSQKINLNSATIEELYSLGFTINQVEGIIEYRNRTGYFHNIYEPLKIPGISISDIHSIRNLVTVETPQESTFEKDMQRASYKMGKWISNEGSTEGLSEVWLDRFFEPQNINNMNYEQPSNLFSFENTNKDR